MLVHAWYLWKPVHALTSSSMVCCPTGRTGGRARVDNFGMKLLSAASIPIKERNSVTLLGVGASRIAFTFSSVGWIPLSEKRRPKSSRHIFFRLIRRFRAFRTCFKFLRARHNCSRSQSLTFLDPRRHCKVLNALKLLPCIVLRILTAQKFTRNYRAHINRMAAFFYAA